MMLGAIERAGLFRVLKKTGGISEVVSSKRPYTEAYSTLNEVARNMIVNGKFKPYLSGEGFIKLQSPKGVIVELTLEGVTA